MVDLVVVSGAGRGIGREIALSLGKSKAKVLCISKTKSAESTVKTIIENGGKAEFLQLDLEDFIGVESKISSWVSANQYKKIGVVLAAAVLGPEGPLDMCDLGLWDTCHKINVLGNLALLKSLLPRMKENKFGRIVFFSGGGAAYANPTFPGYAATKTSVVRIAENMHEDLKGEGDFAVVALAPGAVQTEMLQEWEKVGGKVLTKVDISEPVVFVEEFVNSTKCGFSGRFVHVKNNWKEYLNSNKDFEDDSYWKLRRIED